MFQTCSFSRSFISFFAYALFFYSFFKLGSFPFLLFLGANFALVLAEWSSFVNILSIFGLLSSLVIAGSMALLGYYFYIFGMSCPVLALYPFFMPFAFDLTTFIVDQGYLKISSGSNTDDKITAVGLAFGLIFLNAANWYILKNFNPTVIMNFPSTNFGIFGFSVLTGATILLGKLLVRKIKGHYLFQEAQCSILGFGGFVDRFAPYLFFSYFIALISYGRSFLPQFIAKLFV